MGSTPMGSARKPRSNNDFLNFGVYFGQNVMFVWPRGGRNRVDVSEICIHQSLLCQTEPSGPET